MVDIAGLLAVYDEQMRMPAAIPPAGVTFERDGPVVRIVGNPVGRIRGPRDVGLTGAELDRLIARQRDYFAARGQGVEWKVRSHDLPADLSDRLVAAGFEPEQPTTVFVGFAEEIAAEPVLPDGVTLRRTTEPADMRRIAAQQTEVWGFDCSWLAEELIGRLTADPDHIMVLVAEAGDELACTAWTIFHAGTEFAGLLGGTTLPAWRGRGIYRAMIAARAREAHSRGVRLLQVDASSYSAPILLRSGFHPISTCRLYVCPPPEQPDSRPRP
ncbi:GNAT family N-acetyltransferase [Actinoplanes sp. NEAU-A12]|uniref:GNAT family N-acetyltransferase n=1 Tax=Actinoplanes sandaracinus TaxID=3045177 RepID=A0ABT6WSR1_9ACTN|nr:GNAT family N-acetyltransferase [Actinoplanes sandaracinus]MDI6102680.1 GNAT family N-acetyltransferase [Actinoplanes sandaracinus]